MNVKQSTVAPVVPFLLEHVTLVTGNEQGTAVDDAMVVVGADGLIEFAGPVSQVPETVVRHAGINRYRTVDGAGRHLMPGLINAHAHLFSDGKPLPAFMLKESTEALSSRFLHSALGHAQVQNQAQHSVLEHVLSGVTTLRTVGDVRYEGVETRRRIERGDLMGPRMLVSGPILATTGGHGSPTITLTSDSPWQGRRNARYSIRKGVDCLKIAATGGVTDARKVGEAGRPQMTQEEMQAICEEAHQADMIVAAHAQSHEGVLRALRAGVDTIEHGAPMSEEMAELFRHNPNSLRGWSALIPTLCAAMPLVKLPQTVTGINDVAFENAGIVLRRMLQGVSDALRYGIAVGVGDDSACTLVTQYNTWRELDILHRFSGMSRAAVIHAATQLNAKILGVDAITGSLEVGKAADMVLLTGNPLDDLRALERPEAVVARGHVLLHPKVSRIASIDDALDTI